MLPVKLKVTLQWIGSADRAIKGNMTLGSLIEKLCHLESLIYRKEVDRSAVFKWYLSAMQNLII